MKTDIENEGQRAIQCDHRAQFVHDVARGGLVCPGCGKTLGEIFDGKPIQNTPSKPQIGIDHSGGKDETVVVVRSPQTGDVKVVGITAFKDRLFVALEDGVYELVGDELVRVKLVRDVAMESFMGPSDLLEKAEIEE